MDSYDTILKRMKDKYKEISGRQVPELSDIDLRLKILAGEIYNDEVNLEFIKRQMFANTATSEYLDLHASDRGLTRKEAVKAKGSVQFSISLALENDINIPKGTIVATSGSQAYRFITDNDVTIKSGSRSVIVNCTAEKAGAGSNVAKGSVNVIVTHIMGLEFVTNTNAFTGGADRESDEDLRRRILNTYITISDGTNSAYYKRLALSVSGVSSAGVCPKVRGTGTVDVYICSRNAAATSSLVNQVQALMDKQRELNVDVKVYAANMMSVDIGILVTLKEGYSLSKVKENIKKTVTDYMNSLEVGDSVLENHLGKAILSADGVFDYRWSSLYENHYDVGPNSFAVLGNLSIQEDTE